MLPDDAPSAEEADAAFADLVDQLPQPLGIITHQDSDAAYVRDLCLNQGIVVPERVGILGADDDPSICMLKAPELSSVRVPWNLVGEKLAIAVQKISSGAAHERRTVIPAFGVHARDSTNRIAHSMTDPLVRRFVSLARKMAPEVWAPVIFLPRLGTSQPTLHRHVTQALGRSPNAYIIDLRIAKACELLRDSDLPLAEIAKKSGFANANRLITAFYGSLPCNTGGARSRSWTEQPKRFFMACVRAPAVFHPHCLR